MRGFHPYAACFLVLGLIVGACSDDDADSDTTDGANSVAGGSGTAGRGGGGGAAGAAGAAGVAGAAGANGDGAAGADGGNTAGAAGAAGSGPTGSTGPLTFFVSSTGDDGGNFGGLEGADAFCEELATAVGAGDRTWRAFLSTDDVDARTRIGDGPWHNADGVVVAESLEALFEDGIAVDAANAMNPDADAKRLLLLDETGEPVSVDPLQHDVLTGSDVAGNRIAGQNCDGWTSNTADFTAQLGHSDSRGPQGDDTAFGWVSSHASQGCSAENLVGTGGNGRIYCFAAD